MSRGLRVLGTSLLAVALMTAGARAETTQYGPDAFSTRILTWLGNAPGNRDRLVAYLAVTGQDLAVTDLIYSMDAPLARARALVGLRMGLDEDSQAPDGNSLTLATWLGEDPSHAVTLATYLQASYLHLANDQLMVFGDPAVRFLRTYAVLHLISRDSIPYGRDDNSVLIAYWLRLGPENHLRLRAFLDAQGLASMAITDMIFSSEPHHTSLRQHVAERLLGADAS